MAAAELYRITITVSLDDSEGEGGELVECDFSEGLTRLYALGMLGWATDVANRCLRVEEDDE